MQKTVLLALFMMSLAGCADSQEPVDAAPAEVETMTIDGVVLDPTITPLAGVPVSVLETNASMVTGQDGAFRFTDLPVGVYTVQAGGGNFTLATVQYNENGPLDPRGLIVEPLGASPSSSTARFQGQLQCAAEYVIISGSCDRASTEFGGPSVFTQTSQFEIGLSGGWQTVVIDLAFQSEQLQGFEALRVSTKAGDAADELGSYDRYARHAGSESFSFRIEPGTDYGEATGPVPADIDNLLFDVFAQGQGYGTVCVPEESPRNPGDCFTGVGAGIDLEFELIVTAFYVEPAPEGFSLL